MKLFDRIRIIHSLIVFTLFTSASAVVAQENKSFLGFGVGYNNNMQEINSTGLNVVGEIPISKGSAFYANFHWSLGWVHNGGLHLSSNIAAITTFVLLSNDENNSYLASETAGILIIIPTGITYYLRDSLTSRYGIYLNPLSGDDYNFEINREVLTYCPEFGFKYMLQLQNKTYFYTSAGCAYTMAVKEGSSAIIPDRYRNSPIFKMTFGLAFFRSNGKRKGDK